MQLGVQPALGLLALSVMAWASVVAGQEDDDNAALALSSSNSATAPHSANFAIEAALTDAEQTFGRSDDEQRVSLDFRDDFALGSGWRAIVADRLDADWLGSWGGSQQINTLKEAYVSWQPLPSLLFDVGRINARQGVALGYNPTDFFRAAALRTVDSLDPDTLRDERLGTVMARAETLWDGGALTALYAPHLADTPSNGPFDADWGATNNHGRWLLALSQKLGIELTPQWLLFGAEGSSPQVGVNLTSVLGQSTVVFLEASGGRMPSLWQQSLDVRGPQSTRARVSSGLTYSASNKLSVTLEYEYDGAALHRSGWNLARTGDPETYGRYRDYVIAQQELPTQHSVFAYASWQDFLTRHLDLGAFLRLDLVDHSRLPWTELRYHWPHVDAALRWQDYIGNSTSDFGASPSRQTWQVLVDYYL